MLSEIVFHSPRNLVDDLEEQSQKLNQSCMELECWHPRGGHTIWPTHGAHTANPPFRMRRGFVRLRAHQDRLPISTKFVDPLHMNGV